MVLLRWGLIWPCCPWICHVAMGGLDHLIFLPLPPECWDNGHALHSVFCSIENWTWILVNYKETLFQLTLTHQSRLLFKISYYVSLKMCPLYEMHSFFCFLTLFLLFNTVWFTNRKLSYHTNKVNFCIFIIYWNSIFTSYLNKNSCYKSLIFFFSMYQLKEHWENPLKMSASARVCVFSTYHSLLLPVV